jgi:hemolysin III
MDIRRYIRYIKEPFCGLSHAVGIILSVVALIVLLVEARGRPWHTASFAIYGVTLIVLYTASTLYHSLSVDPRGYKKLQRFDHIAIFLLIAGTYTPVCMVTLRGPWGWSLLGAVWSMALFGIGSSLFWKNTPEWLRVTLCVIMGWLAMVAYGPLKAALTPAGFAWLVGGGIVYSIGTVIFATDWPHLWPGKFSAHDLWHIFVLGGSMCHFIMMLRFVATTA